MKKLLAFIILIGLTKAAGAAGFEPAPALFPTPLSPRLANYRIEVRLDQQAKLLHGRETLTWKNDQDFAVSDLWFHLYQNAFRNDRSTFMREEALAGGIKVKKDGWGFIEINSIRLASGEDLKPTLEFMSPDDDNADDRTVARVVLPRPVEPGGSVTVEIEFVEKLPDPPIARSGAHGNYWFASQWFPKIGVLRKDGWNCHQYHNHTEFFADFGVYDVFITVPADHVVGATGTRAGLNGNPDGTATHYFHAEDVHDFAWVSSPKFKEFTGRSQDVEIRALIQPEHADQGRRHVEAAALGVKYFQDWYGDYPYPNLTVVDPARGAGETGGMEYPTFITAGTVMGMPKGVRPVEMVIIHEFGHNYWYHIVASNEFEDAWLDEGINTYSEIQIMRDLWGKASFADFLGLKLDDLQVRRYSYAQNPDEDPIVKFAWQYYGSGSYRSNAYSKPALGLVTLENYLGHERMLRVMRTYFERWKFRHPVTADFVAVANEAAGEDLDWFFDQLLYANSVLDYALDGVSSRVWKGGAGYDYTVAIPGGPAPAVKPKGKTGQEDELYLNEVKVRRLGGFVFPVEIKVTFADGSSVVEKWDGKDPWKKFYYLKPTKLVAAEVDPEEKIPLDIDWGNNRRTLREEKRPRLETPYYLDMIRFVLNPGK